jgi:hypothetical protein
MSGDMRHATTRTFANRLDDLAYRFVQASLCGFGLIVAICALYVMKSGLGIDLMDGPSPLHGLFYD